MPTTILLVLLLVIPLLYWFSINYLIIKHDPREPPLVPSTVPLVGHLIGLIRHKNKYYVSLRRKHSLPICTLPMPNSRIYVVNSVDLISSVQRLHTQLSFRQVAAKFATTLCASSKEANDIIAVNLNCEDGDWGYSQEVYRTMHPALAPGPGLDGINRAMVQNIAGSIERLRPTREGRPSTTVRLVEWSRHEITMATTNSVYGPHNPFKDRRVEDAFWDFEAATVMLLVNILPSLTARKGNRAREIVANAFTDYFEAKHHESGSMLVQNRFETSRKHKIPIADIARYEVGGSIAVLVNTAPAAFWILFYMFSNPDVLQDCRDEVGTITAAVTDPSTGHIKRTLDITGIKQNCPILTSTFQEVLRQRTLGMQVRQVMQDTMLDDTYLLKKDAMVLMPSLVVHTDPTVWGPDVSAFNHKRFTKESTKASKPGGSTKKPNPKAFRAFGGGTTLCPGRHFATTEILATVVMMIMRYDLIPVAGGTWVAPKTENTNIAAVVMEPDTDIEVTVVPRPGFEDGEWEFKLADSEMVFAVAAEDRT